MSGAQCVAIRADDGGVYTAGVRVDAGDIEVCVVREVGASARRAHWWAASQSVHELAPRFARSSAGASHALGASLLEHWARASLRFSEPDTPEEDEDADEMDARETGHLEVSLPDGTLALDLAPVSDRTAAVCCARLLGLFAQETEKRVAALEAAVRESHAALDAERAKYRQVRGCSVTQLLAANPQKVARYSAASIVHPGRIRYVRS